MQILYLLVIHQKKCIYTYMKKEVNYFMNNLTDIPQDTLYPAMPLRDMVIFPKMITPIFIGRERSIKALKNLGPEDTIFLVTQKNKVEEHPRVTQLYRTGVLSKVLQIIKLQDSSLKILVEGLTKAKVQKFFNRSSYLKVSIDLIEENCPETKETIASKNVIIDLFEEYLNLHKKIPFDSFSNISQVTNLCDFCNIISAQTQIPVDKKQNLLEIDIIEKKLDNLMIYLKIEIDSLNSENKIKSRVKNQIEKNQKDYYLNEQLKAIHKELGEDDYKEELNIYRERINSTKLSKEAQEKCLNELKKLKMVSSVSSESAVIRNYLDWILDLPWQVFTKDNNNLELAATELNKNHYSLDKVKERILEYIAVSIKSKKIGGSIICLYGPPGVGKTSLAYSIAKATNRKFAKITLGGLRDEAEIKGHRRTYIGALPGKIIQSLKKAKSSNALILLDEIDKLGNDHRGDPSSALLEILDNPQNKFFSDHYLEVDFDLSNIMFIATSNSLDIPHPLLDRMEIIKVSGYTEQDKHLIAKNHLIPRIRESHNVKVEEVDIEDNVIMKIIRHYTREAGVRNLNREIEKIFRKSTCKILKEKGSVTVNVGNLINFIGVEKYDYEKKSKKNWVGIVNGLAYTTSGGDLLPIEVVKYKGKGNIKITGQLGEVMKESVQAAYSYIHSRTKCFGIKEEEFLNHDIHIHVPEGAIPKDGPSAGITISTAILSLLTGLEVDRNIAMTGEITLTGRVIGIGGLREKLLAALRAGITKVLIPKENKKDLYDIPEEIKNNISILPVDNFDQVYNEALVSPIIKK